MSIQRLGRAFIVLLTIIIISDSFRENALSNEIDVPAAVRELGQPLINAQACVGMTVGVILGDEVTSLGLGSLTMMTPQVPDEWTVYEIGSITKVFTGLLLADSVQRGEVTLDNLVVDMLPPTADHEQADKQAITLLDLATHTSGLPRLPNNLDVKGNLDNPYSAYDQKLLFEFVKEHGMTRKQDAGYAYSNLGAGLLGTALALKIGVPYEQAVKDRICMPMEMTDTSVVLSASQTSRLAPGHDNGLDQVANWDLKALAGAGAIRSTVSDLLKFVRANLEPQSVPSMTAAIQRSHQPRHETGDGGQIALGWHIRGDTLWHNGQTGGYHSYLGIDKDRQMAVVILANTATGAIDELGVKILDTLRGKKVAPLKLRSVANLDVETLKEYVGKYPIVPSFVLDVTLAGEKLRVQATGQPRFRVYPAEKDRFFYRVVEAKISFTRDDAGKVTGLVLHQNGRDMKAPRNP